MSYKAIMLMVTPETDELKKKRKKTRSPAATILSMKFPTLANMAA